MSVPRHDPGSAFDAVRRWEELAADRTQAAARAADRRAEAQAQAAALIAAARQRAEQAAAGRRQQILAAAHAEATQTGIAGASAIADLTAKAATRRVELLRAALEVILPASPDGPDRSDVVKGSDTSTGRGGACSSE